MALQEEDIIEIESVSFELHEECSWVWEKNRRETKKDDKANLKNEEFSNAIKLLSKDEGEN